MNVRIKIFLLLSLVLLGSIMTYVWIYSRMDHQRLKDELKATANRVEVTFKNEQNAIEMSMLQIATVFAHDQKVQQLFLLGKTAVALEGGEAGGELAAQVRQSLYEHVQQSQKVLAKQFGFRQLHFHFEPGSLSFLRVHRPEKFGDSMDKVRYTIVAANAEQKSTMGFETGCALSGIRGVTPVYAIDGATQEKVHVGALEAGTSFSNLLALFHASRPWLNASVLLSHEHLQANVWPEFLDKLTAENQFIKGFHVEGTTSPKIKKYLAHDDFSKLFLSPGQHLLQDEDSYYNFISLPLRDFRGETNLDTPDAGLIVVWQDVSQQISAYHNRVAFLIFYGFLLFISIETVMFFALNLMTRQLQKELLKTQKQEVDTERARLVSEESSRLKTEFLGNISHELRTPMNAIMGFGKLLGESSLDNRQQDFIDKINLSSKNLLHLIDEILLISELEKQESNKSSTEIFSPSELVNWAMENFTAQAKTRGVKIITDLPDQLPSRLKGYPIQLDRVLKQLLGNAIKFSSGGQVTLALAIMKSDKEAIELEFSVTDQGIGIAKEQQELIFQPFRQGDGSKTRTHGGTGLGLTIVQKVCRQLGGEIRLESTLGQGSCFSFTLQFGVPTTPLVDLSVSSPELLSDSAEAKDAAAQPLGTLAEITQLLDQLEEPLAKLQPNQCQKIGVKLKGKQWPENLSEEIEKLAALIGHYRFVDALDAVRHLKNNLQ